MGEAWYEELPEDAFVTETDKAYNQALSKIREGLDKGLDFDSACGMIEVEDEELKKNIIDDILKVLIAEEHFAKNVSLDELSKKLKVPKERLDSAKLSMMEEIKDTSIKAFYKGIGSNKA